MSHELKTPLTAVREGAELLRDRVGGELSPEQREIVRIVRENTLQLQKLIEDLLTYHQTRAMEPQALGPVALSDVVRRVIKGAQARRVRADGDVRGEARAGAGRRRRRADPHDHRQPHVECDQVFAALGARSPSALASRSGFAVLDVVDQGHGVDPDERERIFESFYQGKPPAKGG